MCVLMGWIWPNTISPTYIDFPDIAGEFLLYHHLGAQNSCEVAIIWPGEWFSVQRSFGWYRCSFQHNLLSQSVSSRKCVFTRHVPIQNPTPYKGGHMSSPKTAQLHGFFTEQICKTWSLTTLEDKNPWCLSLLLNTPLKIDMEHNHGGLEDDFSFLNGWFVGSMLIFQCILNPKRSWKKWKSSTKPQVTNPSEILHGTHKVLDSRRNLHPFSGSMFLIWGYVHHGKLTNGSSKMRYSIASLKHHIQHFGAKLSLPSQKPRKINHLGKMTSVFGMFFRRGKPHLAGFVET